MKTTVTMPAEHLKGYYDSICGAAAFFEEIGDMEKWELLYGVAMEVENELRDRGVEGFV